MLLRTGDLSKSPDRHARKARAQPYDRDSSRSRVDLSTATDLPRPANTGSIPASKSWRSLSLASRRRCAAVLKVPAVAACMERRKSCTGIIVITFRGKITGRGQAGLSPSISGAVIGCPVRLEGRGARLHNDFRRKTIRLHLKLGWLWRWLSRPWQQALCGWETGEASPPFRT